MESLPISKKDISPKNSLINFCNQTLSTTLNSFTEIPIYVYNYHVPEITLETVYLVLNEYKNAGWTVDLDVRHFKTNFWGRKIECATSEREYSVYTLIFR